MKGPCGRISMLVAMSIFFHAVLCVRILCPMGLTVILVYKLALGEVRRFLSSQRSIQTVLAWHGPWSKPPSD